MNITDFKYLYVPFLMWFGIQTFKVIYDLITTKKFNFKRIMGAGGMPSSHSAVVTSLATLIGKNQGFDSPVFAISVIFAVVVMYDAAGVRRPIFALAVIFAFVVMYDACRNKACCWKTSKITK